MNQANQINTAIVKHVESHRVGGKDWPASAMFAAKYNMSTWPCGWGTEALVRFFDSEEELQEWIADKHDWAKCEDNYVAFSVYEWDLGPTFRMDLSHDVHNVGKTWEEKQHSAIFG